MVEIMKYVSIIGRVNELDMFIEKHISRYDIQMEYAAKMLPETEPPDGEMTENPYAEAAGMAGWLKNAVGVGAPKGAVGDISCEKAVRIIDYLYGFAKNRDENYHEYIKQREALEKAASALDPFKALNFDLGRLSGSRFMHYQFGRMPLENFRQFEEFLYDNSEMLFVEGSRDREMIWGVYLTPLAYAERADSLIGSLHFEKIDFTDVNLNGYLRGTPESAIASINAETARLGEQINRIHGATLSAADELGEELHAAIKKIEELYVLYDIKKYAARTRTGFFVFVGWMNEADAKSLAKEADREVMEILVRDEKTPGFAAPPTKLKNPPVIRFFEFFVKMYGAPSYGETDPTFFIAFAYTVIFGLMFGDIGQGFLIFALGLFIYRKKKAFLGAIMSVIGVSSMFFGALYGSVFGLEDLVPAIWRKPQADIMTTLIIGVGFGIFLILTSMAVNIINGAKQGDRKKLFLSPNGVAGAVFYCSVLLIALTVVLGGQSLYPYKILIYVAAASLLAIALREPASVIFAGRKRTGGESAGMFILELVMGLFETLLTFFTNTVSFVRLGAFALSHAGMMSVVMLLSENAGGSRNIFVIVIGNILIMALEGLVVGIQALRLSYYEMFSRFYDGGGRLFESYKNR